MTNTATASRPMVLADSESIDGLATFPSVKVRTRDLRPGMVLLDDLDTPAGVLDHRMGCTRGVVAWMYEDLDSGGWKHTSFAVSLNPTVTVAARP